MTITFTVEGKPATAGSYRGFTYKRKSGGMGVRMEAADPKAPLWRNAVAIAAREAYDGPLLTGPIILEVRIEFPRPKGHFGTGRNAGVLKASAPRWHIQKPDLGKCIRAIEDALKGVLFRDDSQIFHHVTGKCWGERYHTEVTLTEPASNCGSSRGEAHD